MLRLKVRLQLLFYLGHTIQIDPDKWAALGVVEQIGEVEQLSVACKVLGTHHHRDINSRSARLAQYLGVDVYFASGPNRSCWLIPKGKSLYEITHPDDLSTVAFRIVKEAARGMAACRS